MDDSKPPRPGPGREVTQPGASSGETSYQRALRRPPSPEYRGSTNPGLTAPVQVAVAPPRRGPKKPGVAARLPSRLTGVEETEADTLIENADPEFKDQIGQLGDVSTNILRLAKDETRQAEPDLVELARAAAEKAAWDKALAEERAARKKDAAIPDPALQKLLEDIGDI